MKIQIIALVAMLAGSNGTPGQEVIVPDTGLNAAIRGALQKPTGPLTEQDMLGLTNLNAGHRNIRSIEGLEAARNLVSLDLQINSLTNVSVPNGLTKLAVLNLNINSLTNCTLPDGLTNLTTLSLEGNSLTTLVLPQGLTALNGLDLANNNISKFDAVSNLATLAYLDLGFNAFTNFALPATLTNLMTFVFDGNPAKEISIPAGLRAITELHLSQNQLVDFTLPAGMTNLLTLDLSFNQLTNVSLPDDLQSLGGLELDYNRLTTVNLPTNLTHLGTLLLRSNLLTTIHLPDDMKNLTFLDLGENQLTNVALPAGLHDLRTLRLSGNPNLFNLVLPVGMTNLQGLFLRFNQLTNLTLPPDLRNLVQIDALGNQLTHIDLPAGLTNLMTLVLSGNQLTNLTLPPDVTKLSSLVLDGNPLATVVMSEPLAGNFVEEVGALRDRGVLVFTYGLSIELLDPLPLAGAFRFGISGPPGTYSVFRSTDFTDWTFVNTASNPLGKISFVDITSNATLATAFYRVLPQSPPTNMIFVPANTFTMGSPANEFERQADEGPQTIVTLTHGYWIGKYEVTQAEYLAVTGTNPSFFVGDLSLPVSSVSWADATNYCYLLTKRELAAGRIPVGSRYRLPTEAEWECAARAGTTTRYSHGDDTNYVNVPDYAWYSANANLTAHSVGQKLPNPWGLYDIEGNVWEWCQDWYGDHLPGGTMTDPTGPGPSAAGWKVMRGGAYDFWTTDCRSARRLFFHPVLNDTDLGFRVVLVSE
ncbi:MAG TPA: SUMF1/EgtB/PvdO family nonheme iron enzyme [Verrucomicrobiae bacterium]